MARIAFLGLGGVGGYFGAKMARVFADRNDAEIVFLARERTAEAIRTNGIQLITPEEEFVAHPSVVATTAEEAGAIDYLIVSVKSYDLETSLGQFRGCIYPGTVILPLLNGLDAEEKIRAMFPGNEVWNGCVYIVSRLTAPGIITETGNIHRLHFGGTPAAKTGDLYTLLKQSHDDIFLHTDIRNIAWEKFVFISPLASLTSYLDACLGKILENPVSKNMLEQLLREICSVASAEKIILPEDIISTTFGKMGKLPYETTSSMHSDFQKKSKTEFRSLTGHVVQLAQKHRLSVPFYEAILYGLETRLKIAPSHN